MALVSAEDGDKLYRNEVTQRYVLQRGGFLYVVCFTLGDLTLANRRELIDESYLERMGQFGWTEVPIGTNIEPSEFSFEWPPLATETGPFSPAGEPDPSL